MAESYASQGLSSLSNRSRLSASFAFVPPQSSPACLYTAGPPCAVWECSATPPEVDPRPHAGAILVAGGAQQPDLTLTPNADGFYSSDVIVDEHFFNSSDELAFTGAGGEVPAFEQVATPPGVVTVTDPAISEGMPLSSWWGDYPISWEGDVSGAVELWLVGTDDLEPGHSLIIVCSYPATDATGVLTQEVIGLAQGFANHRLTVVTSSWATALGDLPNGGTWSVAFGLKQGAITPAGELVDVSVNLQ